MLRITAKSTQRCGQAGSLEADGVEDGWGLAAHSTTATHSMRERNEIVRLSRNTRYVHGLWNSLLSAMAARCEPRRNMRADCP